MWDMTQSYSSELEYDMSHVPEYLTDDRVYCSVLQCDAVCSSVLQCVDVLEYLTTIECVAVCCSVMQCVQGGSGT